MGKTLPDGMLYRLPVLYDLNLKTGVGSHVVGYSEYTDRDGDKIIAKDKGKFPGGLSGAGEWAFVKGTGKFEGIQGKGTWISHSLSPTQWYVDWEGEVELPQK